MVGVGDEEDDRGGHAAETRISAEGLGLGGSDTQSDERLRDFLCEDRRLVCSLVGENQIARLTDENCEGQMKNWDLRTEPDAAAVLGPKL